MGMCEQCMLDPSCGFCYRDNGSALFASSCAPVNMVSTEQAAWGRCSNTSQGREQTFWAYNYCPTPYSWLVLLGLLLYLAAFAPGMGPMPWTINSEIYPLWARGVGNACSTGVNWSFNILVSLTFLHTAQLLTYYGVFFLYAGAASVGVVFVYAVVPETKGRRLEEVEALFEGRLCSCGATESDEGRQVEYIRVKGSNYHLSDNDASDTKGRRLEEVEALFEGRLCSCGATESDEGRQVEYIRVKGSNYHLSDNDASDVD
ncbi:hypothetical protein CRUP_033018 [Coryphaenoides rupestris]|nr:hypothetical protein CRUP_033018 [Coryphaenoides rupestris]